MWIRIQCVGNICKEWPFIKHNAWRKAICLLTCVTICLAWPGIHIFFYKLRCFWLVKKIWHTEPLKTIESRLQFFSQNFVCVKPNSLQVAMESFGRQEFLWFLAEGCVAPTAWQGLEQVWQLLLVCCLCRIVCRLSEFYLHLHLFLLETLLPKVIFCSSLYSITRSENDGCTTAI